MALRCPLLADNIENNRGYTPRFVKRVMRQLYSMNTDNEMIGCVTCVRTASRYRECNLFRSFKEVHDRERDERRLNA